MSVHLLRAKISAFIFVFVWSLTSLAFTTMIFTTIGTSFCNAVKPYFSFDQGDMEEGRSVLSVQPLSVVAWPWVIYYKKFKNKWFTQGSIKHTILEQDTVRRLETPEISMIGRAVCYSFSDGDL
uniref:Uncharacterized protein LOC111133310 n=1 Tax=Crassostrea virginica TaxID=6565 RepID=A0A8B8EC92_CRAVI|nr:uncharacterized protein LOC111133310 [Crassostrea virginica]